MSVWMPKPNLNTYSCCHDAWLFSAVASLSVSAYAREGISKAGKEPTRLRCYRFTLQEPQEQPVPAQELEQQLVQELDRGARGQQKFVADEEA
jgi:hypothetical protein